MKFSVVYDYQIFSRQKYGGISRYFVEVASRVSTIVDISATTIAPVHLNRHLDDGKYQYIGRRFEFSTKIGRLIGPANDFLFKRKLKRGNFDIIHRTYYTKARLPSEYKVVLTVFDMVHELYPELLHRLDRTTVAKRIAVDQADHIICISECTKRDLMQMFGVPEEKISVVLLGFSLRADARGDGYPDRTGTAGNQPFILYVGHRHAYKNFDRFLEAYASSRRLRASHRVVAFGARSFTQREIARFREFGLTDQDVTWIGGGDNVLRDLYETAAMFVYPSLYEGFGIPPLEAMNFECPVVCSNTSSIPEVVGNAAEFFDPLDVDSIRTGMEKVAFDRTRRDELIALGRQRVQLFSWDRCAAETAAVYKNLLGA